MNIVDKMIKRGYSIFEVYDITRKFAAIEELEHWARSVPPMEAEEEQGWKSSRGRILQIAKDSDTPEDAADAIRSIIDMVPGPQNPRDRGRLRGLNEALDALSKGGAEGTTVPVPNAPGYTPDVAPSGSGDGHTYAPGGSGRSQIPEDQGMGTTRMSKKASVEPFSATPLPGKNKFLAFQDGWLFWTGSSITPEQYINGGIASGEFEGYYMDNDYDPDTGLPGYINEPSDDDFLPSHGEVSNFALKNGFSDETYRFAGVYKRSDAVQVYDYDVPTAQDLEELGYLFPKARVVSWGMSDHPINRKVASMKIANDMLLTGLEEILRDYGLTVNIDELVFSDTLIEDAVSLKYVILPNASKAIFWVPMRGVDTEGKTITGLPHHGHFYDLYERFGFNIDEIMWGYYSSWRSNPVPTVTLEEEQLTDNQFMALQSYFPNCQFASVGYEEELIEINPIKQGIALSPPLPPPTETIHQTLKIATNLLPAGNPLPNLGVTFNKQTMEYDPFFYDGPIPDVHNKFLTDTNGNAYFWPVDESLRPAHMAARKMLDKKGIDTNMAGELAPWDVNGLEGSAGYPVFHTIVEDPWELDFIRGMFPNLDKVVDYSTWYPLYEEKVARSMSNLPPTFNSRALFDLKKYVDLRGEEINWDAFRQSSTAPDGDIMSLLEVLTEIGIAINGDENAIGGKFKIDNMQLEELLTASEHDSGITPVKGKGEAVREASRGLRKDSSVNGVQLFRGLAFGEHTEEELNQALTDPVQFIENQTGMYSATGIHWTDDISSAENFALGLDNEGWASSDGDFYDEEEVNEFNVGIVLEAEVEEQYILDRESEDFEMYQMGEGILDYSLEREVTIMDGSPIEIKRIYILYTDLQSGITNEKSVDYSKITTADMDYEDEMEFEEDNYIPDMAFLIAEDGQYGFGEFHDEISLEMGLEKEPAWEQAGDVVSRIPTAIRGVVIEGDIFLISKSRINPAQATSAIEILSDIKSEYETGDILIECGLMSTDRFEGDIDGALNWIANSNKTNELLASYSNSIQGSNYETGLYDGRHTGGSLYFQNEEESEESSGDFTFVNLNRVPIHYFQKFADRTSVEQKADSIYSQGGVEYVVATPDPERGRTLWEFNVTSTSGQTYPLYGDTEIDNPTSWIDWFDVACSCDWGRWNYDRAPEYRHLERFPCSHAMATEKWLAEHGSSEHEKLMREHETGQQEMRFETEPEQGRRPRPGDVYREQVNPDPQVRPPVNRPTPAQQPLQPALVGDPGKPSNPATPGPPVGPTQIEPEQPPEPVPPPPVVETPIFRDQILRPRTPVENSDDDKKG